MLDELRSVRSSARRTIYTYYRPVEVLLDKAIAIKNLVVYTLYNMVG